jgi:hypothetical protein
MRFHRTKRFIASTLVVLIVLLSCGQIFAPKKAQAIWGIGDISFDPALLAETIFDWAYDAARYLAEHALDIALKALKKRLIDTMTDQIVNWINGGRTPRFTQDFGSVFRDAADAAVGDVISQYAGTKTLCQPFAFNINLQLQQPAPLSQQVRCSLSDIVRNFDAYRKDFSTGGWLAYQELLKPQNNQWGVEIITLNEIQNRTIQKTNESVLKQQVNVGFNSEECTRWDVYDKRTGRPATTRNGTAYTSLGPTNPAKSPSDTPPTPPGNDPDLEYRCTKSQITTPGQALAQGLTKSLYSNIDLAINDPDIENALAIVADAAFNRLIKAGASGLKNIGSSGTTESDLRNSINKYGSARSNVENSAKASIKNGVRGLALQANDILNVLSTASTTNNQLISTANELSDCLNGKSSPNTTDTAWVSNILTSSTLSYKRKINDSITAAQQLITQINRTADDIDRRAADETGDSTSALLQQLSEAVAGQMTEAINRGLDEANKLAQKIQNDLNTAQTKLQQCQN